MEDLNIDKKPYKKGDKLIIEIEITDVEKSFEFLCKSIMRRKDMSEFGFEVDKLILSENKYVESLSVELRTEIANKLQRSMDEIREMLQIL